jgi:pyruvate/2-oxoglutarate dehydrogenase complex dihydrolipoamide acyltransferase (E2) component
VQVIEIRMPKPGQAISEGRLIQFYVDDGGRAVFGEPLYELDTDKSTMDIESPASGVLRHVAAPGEEYQVGELLATIEEETA